MSLTVADIVAKVRADGVPEMVRQFREGEQATSSFTERAERMGRRLQGVGTALSLGGTLPITAFAVASVNAASDLAEATSAAAITYGDAAGLIMENARQSAQVVGLSSTEYLTAATRLGVFGQSAGLTGIDLANFGNSTVNAAADLASFYNAAGGVPEVMEAIQSGLAGETEPLRRYGIFLSEAAVNEYAWAHGIAARGAVLTEDQKILARQGFILDNLGAAEGDFYRTSGGLANQQRILKAEIANLSAELGKVLLPLTLRVVTALRGFVAFLSDLSPRTRTAIVVVGALVAALGPLLVIMGTILTSAATLGPALAGAFAIATGPIGLLVIAAAGLAYLFRGQLGDALKNAIGFVKSLADNFIFFRDTGVNPLASAVFALYASLLNVFGTDNPVLAWVGESLPALVSFTDGIFDVIDTIKDFFSTLTDLGFDEAIGVLAANIQNMFGNDALTGAVVNGLEVIRDLLHGEWRSAWENLQDFAGDASELATDVADWLWEALSSVRWGNIFTAGVNLVGDAGQLVIDALNAVSDLGVKLKDWFTDKTDDVDWDGLLKLAWNDLSNVLDDLPGKITGTAGDLKTTLETWWTSGTAVAWRDKLGTAWNVLTGFATDDLLPKLGVMPDVLADWWDKVSEVHWTDVLGTAWNTLRDFLSSDALPKLGNVSDVLGGWWSVVTSISWKETLGSAWNVLRGLVTQLPGKIESGADTLLSVLQGWWDQVADLGWKETLGAAWDTLGDLITELPGKLGDASGQLVTWWTDEIGQVDWVDLLKTGIGAAIDAGDYLFHLGKDVIVGIKKWAAKDESGEAGTGGEGGGGGGLRASIQNTIDEIVDPEPFQVSPEVQLNIEQSTEQSVNEAFNGIIRSMISLDPETLLYLSGIGTAIAALLFLGPVGLGAVLITYATTWAVYKFGPALGQIIGSAIRGVWNSIPVQLAIQGSKLLFDQLYDTLNKYHVFSSIPILGPVVDSLDEAYRAASRLWNILVQLRNFFGMGGGTHPDNEIFPPVPPQTPDEGRPEGGEGPTGLGRAGGGSGRGSLPALGPFIGSNVGIANLIAQMGIVEVPKQLDTVTTSFTGFAATATRLAEAAGQGFKNMFVRELQEFAASSTNIILGITSMLQRFAGDATRYGGLAGDGFSNSLVPKIRGAATATAGIIALGLLATLSGAVAPAGLAGTAIGQSFASRLLSVLQGIPATTRGIIGGIIGAMRVDASPSGRYIGDSLGLGIVQGIQGRVADAARAAANLVRSTIIAAEIEGAIHSPSDKTQRIGNALVDGYLLPFVDRLDEARARSAAFIDRLMAGGQARTGAPLVPATATAPVGGTRYYLVIDADVLRRFIETTDAVEVLTSPAEIAATWGS